MKLQNDRVLYISLIIIFAIVFSLVILILRMKLVRSRQEQREAELSQTLLRTQMNPHTGTCVNKISINVYEEVIESILFRARNASLPADFIH